MHVLAEYLLEHAQLHHNFREHDDDCSNFYKGTSRQPTWYNLSYVPFYLKQMEHGFISDSLF